MGVRPTCALGSTREMFYNGNVKKFGQRRVLESSFVNRILCLVNTKKGLHEMRGTNDISRFRPRPRKGVSLHTGVGRRKKLAF